MELDKEFSFDPDAAAEGVWVKVGDGELLIAAFSNDKSDAYLNPFRTRYRRMGKEVPESIYEEALAKHVLLGWKNMKDAGEEIEPTEKNRLAMVRKYRRFKGLVLQLSMDPANFAVKEEERKNSQSGPSGISGSAH